MNLSVPDYSRCFDVAYRYGLDLADPSYGVHSWIYDSRYKIVALKLWTCRGLRHESAAAHLLGLWVRIPPGHGCLSREFCVLSDRGLCDELITRPEESYQLWCVCVWSWILDNNEALAHWGLLRHCNITGRNIVSNAWILDYCMTLFKSRGLCIIRQVELWIRKTEFRKEHRTRTDPLKVCWSLQISYCYVFLSRNFVVILLT